MNDGDGELAAECPARRQGASPLIAAKVVVTRRPCSSGLVAEIPDQVRRSDPVPVRKQILICTRNRFYIASDASRIGRKGDATVPNGRGSLRPAGGLVAAVFLAVPVGRHHWPSSEAGGYAGQLL